MGDGVRAGIGAVFFDPDDGTCETWGAWLPAPPVSLLRKFVDSDQLVGQAELLPAIGARLSWGSRMKGGAVLHFIDNDAARFGLIAGYSPSLASRLLIGRFWTIQCGLLSRSWFERVPSPSNPARAMISPIWARRSAQRSYNGATAPEILSYHRDATKST